jgi:hypothetical protein
MVVVTDWHAWHRDYKDSNSSLSRRLAVVQDRLSDLLSGRAPVAKVLSLCAGDGRDILPVVARLPSDQRPEVLLVELDSELASAAEERAARLGVAATVVRGDAGSAAIWQDFLPVDVLLLCGILGNISQEDIRVTIEAARAMVVAGGAVIWTRGYFTGKDLRLQVRRWFSDAGFKELAFDAEPTGYGVGTNRLRSTAPIADIPARLFSFVR